jgi:palmitoyl-protein thioesterase
MPKYLKTTFLPDVNNVNPVYAYNLGRLKSFALVRFSKDELIFPRDSAWFASLNATDRSTIAMQNQTIYKDLGLDLLRESRRF